MGEATETAAEPAPAPAPAAAGGSVDIVVPTLGESVTEATVAKWFKAVGDAVAADEALVELETDKVSVEVNAPSAGTLASINAAEGTEENLEATEADDAVDTGDDVAEDVVESTEED